MGYLDEPKETAETYLEDGFLRTGDIGAMLPDGFLIIQDRIKEMIKVRLNYSAHFLSLSLTNDHRSEATPSLQPN
jgi:hypothetical protein